VPIAAVASLVLYNQLGLVRQLSKNQSYFLAGIVIYLVVHSLFYKPAYFYILGHEVTHALFTWLCGGRVTSFKATLRGGRVTTTKSNFLITLGPYFFPIYTVLIACVYFVVSVVYKLSGECVSAFIFLIGFSWALHLVLTVDFIKMEQPDIVKMGPLFSICLIYIANLIIVAFILSLLFSAVSFADFVRDSWLESGEFYRNFLRGLFL
jgi:hypothetical protein